LEGRLHAISSTGSRDTAARHVDSQRHVIALHADAEGRAEANDTKDDAIPTEKTVFQLCDDDEKRNTPFTLTREELKVAANIDGFRDVQTIAENLRTPYDSTMNVVRRLHRLGLVKVVSTNRTSDSVPVGFFDIMMSVLTDAVGPIARIIMQDQLKVLGSNPKTFPKSQLMRLVVLVSREILHDRLRSEFEARMFDVIRALDSADNRSQ
jgi:hypothetical protein